MKFFKYLMLFFVLFTPLLHGGYEDALKQFFKEKKPKKYKNLLTLVLKIQFFRSIENIDIDKFKKDFVFSREEDKETGFLILKETITPSGRDTSNFTKFFLDLDYMGQIKKSAKKALKNYPSKEKSKENNNIIKTFVKEKMNLLFPNFSKEDEKKDKVPDLIDTAPSPTEDPVLEDKKGMDAGDLMESFSDAGDLMESFSDAGDLMESFSDAGDLMESFSFDATVFDDTDLVNENAQKPTEYSSSRTTTRSLNIPDCFYPACPSSSSSTDEKSSIPICPRPKHSDTIQTTPFFFENAALSNKTSSYFTKNEQKFLKILQQKIYPGCTKEEASRILFKKYLYFFSRKFKNASTLLNRLARIRNNDDNFFVDHVVELTAKEAAGSYYSAYFNSGDSFLKKLFMERDLKSTEELRQLAKTAFDLALVIFYGEHSTSSGALNEDHLQILLTNYEVRKSGSSSSSHSSSHLNFQEKLKKMKNPYLPSWGLNFVSNVGHPSFLGRNFPHDDDNEPGGYSSGTCSDYDEKKQNESRDNDGISYIRDVLPSAPPVEAFDDFVEPGSSNSFEENDSNVNDDDSASEETDSDDSSGSEESGDDSSAVEDEDLGVGDQPSRISRLMGVAFRGVKGGFKNFWGHRDPNGFFRKRANQKK